MTDCLSSKLLSRACNVAAVDFPQRHERDDGVLIGYSLNLDYL